MAKLFVEKIETLVAVVQDTRQEANSSSWWLNLKMNCTLAASTVASLASLTSIGYCLFNSYTGVGMSATNSTEAAVY